MRVRVPELEIAPPAAPELVANRQFCTVSVPLLTTALAVAAPSVRPVRVLVVPDTKVRREAGFVTPKVIVRSEVPGPEMAVFPVTGGNGEERTIVPIAEMRI